MDKAKELLPLGSAVYLDQGRQGPAAPGFMLFAPGL